MIQSTLCYLERNDCYLMLHRVKKKNDINHDKWIGVGGKLEDRESPEDCMKREIFEETGLSVRTWAYRGIVTFVSDAAETEYMHLYLVTDWEGDVKECDEGVLEWIRKRDLLALPMWEGDRIFLELLQREEEPFFSLKLTYEGDRLARAEKNGRPLV